MFSGITGKLKISFKFGLSGHNGLVKNDKAINEHTMENRAESMCNEDP